MPNYKYEHVHLTSPDPLKTAEFYERMFGAKRGEVMQMPDGGTMVFLNLHGSNIIVSKPTGEPPFYGLEHFGLITDDIEVAVAELKANGVRFRDEIREFAPGIKIAFFWDPEDILIELVEIKS